MVGTGGGPMLVPSRLRALVMASASCNFSGPTELGIQTEIALFISLDLLTRFLNPRFHWCYQFEDYMGMIVTIARKCTASTPTTRVGSKVMENLLLTFAFALEHH